MQHAVALSGEDDEQVMQTTALSNIEPGAPHPAASAPLKLAFSYTWFGIKSLFHLLHPATIRHGYDQLCQMTMMDLIRSLFVLLMKSTRLLFIILIFTFRYVGRRSVQSQSFGFVFV